MRLQSSMRRAGKKSSPSGAITNGAFNTIYLQNFVQLNALLMLGQLWYEGNSNLEPSVDLLKVELDMWF